MRRLAKVLLVALLGVASDTFASDFLAIRLLGESSGFAGQVAARLEARIRLYPNEFQLVTEPEKSSPIGRQIAVALGGKGWSQLESFPSDVPALAVIPPRNIDSGTLGGGRLVPIIYGEMAPSRMFNFASIFAQYQRSTSVSVIAGPQTQLRVNKMELLAAERGLHLRIERVEREADIGPAVERLAPHGGILLALPDQVAHSASTVSPILMTTYRAGIPVIAYSEPYLKAGAVAALYATPDQVATQVMETLTNIRLGRPVTPAQYLKYFTVGVNRTVSRSLGINPPSVEELESRLRGMKE